MSTFAYVYKHCDDKRRNPVPRISDLRSLMNPGICGAIMIAEETPKVQSPEQLPAPSLPPVVMEVANVLLQMNQEYDSSEQKFPKKTDKCNTPGECIEEPIECSWEIIPVSTLK